MIAMLTPSRLAHRVAEREARPCVGPARTSGFIGQAVIRARDPLVDPRENAAQYVDLLPLESGPGEQPPQSRQEPLWTPGVEKAHRGERDLGVGVESFDFVLRGRCKGRRSPHLVAMRGEMELVGRDLDRGGEIERRTAR